MTKNKKIEKFTGKYERDPAKVKKPKKEKDNVWYTVPSGKYKGIKYKRKNGLVSQVSNPKGKKSEVAIVQRGNYSGFTAVYRKGLKGFLGRSRNAEKLAGDLAYKGHRLVTFLD